MIEGGLEGASWRKWFQEGLRGVKEDKREREREKR